MKTQSPFKELPAVKTSNLSLIIIALLSLYVFWGGTYLGMKVAIETMPPFLMAGIRFSIAGWVLYFIARYKGAASPKLHEWKSTGIVGALLLLGGNGVVAWAEQKVPSSIASLMVSTVPLWIILFNWLGKSRKRPGLGVMAGVVLGLAGIAILVFHPDGAEQKAIDSIGILALLFASVSWSAGSLYSRNASLPPSPLLSTAMQMIVGGLLLLLVSFLTGDWGRLEVSELSLRSLIALGYLIIFGSIIGYTSYIWLLKNAEPAWVSTYAFVNPMVALFLGWLLAGEALTVNGIIASAVIIAAVVLITVFRDKAKS